MDIFGQKYLPGAKLLHLQSPPSGANSQTANATGYFAQFPPLRARSYYALKLSASGYLDSYTGGGAPLKSGSTSFAFLYLFTKAGLNTVMPNPACGGVSWNQSQAGMYITFDKAHTGKWKAYVGSSGAKVVYAKPPVGSAVVFDCAQPHVDIPATSTKGGALIAYNIDTSSSKLVWIVYKNGNKLVGSLVTLGASSWSYVFPWVPWPQLPERGRDRLDPEQRAELPHVALRPGAGVIRVYETRPNL